MAVSTPATIKGVSNSHGVANRASELGMVAWIIMAPEMFASASRSLPWRTQISALMVSGNSVATGLSTRATRCGGSENATPIASS